MNDINISYKKQGVNLETCYTIEYIDNKKDSDRMEKHSAPWELYKTKTFTDLQEAITTFIHMYSNMVCENGNILEVKLFEEIKLDGETIQERYITDIFNFKGITDSVTRHIRDKFSYMEQTIDQYENEYTGFKAFLKLYHGEESFRKFQENGNKQKQTS